MSPNALETIGLTKLEHADHQPLPIFLRNTGNKPWIQLSVKQICVANPLWSRSQLWRLIRYTIKIGTKQKYRRHNCSKVWSRRYREYSRFCRWSFHKGTWRVSRGESGCARDQRNWYNRLNGREKRSQTDGNWESCSSTGEGLLGFLRWQQTSSGQNPGFQLLLPWVLQVELPNQLQQ